VVPGWDPIDMEKAAFHEVWHAVVAWSFNLVVHRVYLDIANNSGGMQTPSSPPNDVTHRNAISYAGFEAENIFKGPASFLRADDDRTRAWGVIANAIAPRNIFSLEGRRLEIASRACAQERLREHTKKLRQVAKRLLKSPHEITREQFEQLMQD